MENAVTINQKPVSIREYNGQRVITFRDIDTVHERPEGTARRNFRANRKHLIEGVDYHVVTRDNSMDEIRTLDVSIPPKGITVITETGYLMLVKSFTDDLAWKVQRQLVNTYFRAKALSKYSTKATSLGEVVNLIREFRLMANSMGYHARDIADIAIDLCEQFNIKVPEKFKKPVTPGQMSLDAIN